MKFPKEEFIHAFGEIERYTRKRKKIIDKITHFFSITIIKRLKK